MPDKGRWNDGADEMRIGLEMKCQRKRTCFRVYASPNIAFESIQCTTTPLTATQRSQDNAVTAVMVMVMVMEILGESDQGSASDGDEEKR